MSLVPTPITRLGEALACMLLGHDWDYVYTVANGLDEDRLACARCSARQTP